MKLLVILTFIAIYLISSQKVSAQNGISLDTSISKNVAVVRYDPLIVEQGNRPLSQVYGWGDSTFNSTKFADMMRVATQGVVNYQIVDNIVINKFPLKTDGFRYTWTSYSACRQNTSTCHFPDDASYAELMLRDTNLCQRIQNNQIDEVCLWG